MAERNDHFRRDFETVEEYHKRLDAEAAQRATFEPDIGEVLEQPEPQKTPVIVKPGNYYARLGSVQEWLWKEKEQSLLEKREDFEAGEED